MNTTSIILFFSMIAGMVYLAGTKVAKDENQIVCSPSSKSFEDRDTKRDADHLAPDELFYLDRNYPDYDASPDLFHQQLKQVMKTDKVSARSHRGLDFPWTVEGPGNIGGRVNTIAVDPHDPDIILLGYSQGGIYRTDDGGIKWEPVFDDQVSLSISHISFDPHHPQRVLAATGDVNISGYPFLGSGVYKSDDDGLHWAYVGLNGTGVLSKVTVDPNNENLIYAGSMGYPSRKGNERGFFRSIDAGAHWDKTLTIDDSTGVIDLVTDPVRPGYVYATSWTRLRSSRISTTIGPGTGIYRSKDFGMTWENIIDILPGGLHSRTSVDISADGTLLISYMGYVDDTDCSGYNESLKGIYKSIDGADTWSRITADQSVGLPCDLFGSFGWYFEALKVNPDNADDISLLGVDLYRTLDGGATWFLSAPEWWRYEVHADKHDLVFANGQMYLATDGGAYSCPADQSQPWRDIENIPSTQFYRTAFNPHQPDQYIGGAQDNGTSTGNANMINDWYRVYGGDGFQPRFDPTEPSWAYYMIQNGDIAWTMDGFNFNALDSGLVGTRYWDMPFVMSIQDPKILYCGTNQVFRIDMRDTIPVWMSISPDLTRGVPVLGSRYPAITAIAQSDLDEMRLYAGTQDGKIWTTTDGGLNWIDIADGTPGYYVTSITCSTKNPQGVITTYSGYRDNDNTPYIYKSENAGTSWSSLGVNAPLLGVNSMLILPGWNDDILFAATDGGVYVSFNAGIMWDRLGSEFPYMPVYDLEYNPVENTIVAATFSRGLMTFPVEELDLMSGIGSEPQNTTLTGIQIYPTIVDDYFTIEFENANPENDHLIISIIDVSGHLIQKLAISQTIQHRTKLELNRNISPGFYFVQMLNQENGKIICPFIKQ